MSQVITPLKIFCWTAFILTNKMSVAQTWSQIGSDLDGDSFSDKYGWSVDISLDGTRIITGSLEDDFVATNCGYLHVLSWDGSNWNQMGNKIYGDSIYGKFSSAVAISGEGNRIAMSGNQSSLYDDSGVVRIYEWDGNDWNQIGNDISGLDTNASVGSDLAFSLDGAIIAIGTQAGDVWEYMDGVMKIYEWDGMDFNIKGQELFGNSQGDKFGTSVSISQDGLTVAGGAPSGEADLKGYVKVFTWSGTSWVQKGIDILGESANDQSGCSISMSSDGNIIAIGAHGNDAFGVDVGHCRVYEWDGSAWIQKGTDINGQASGDNFGKWLDLSSDGNTVVIGAPWNDGSGANAGQLKVYEWNGISWVQKGADVNGELAGDQLGHSCAISGNGNNIIGGAYLNDANGTSSGSARVFSCAPTIDNPSDVIACGSYVLPALTAGSYFTGSNGSGINLFAGNTISTSQTIYVYATNGTCSSENSFLVSIESLPIVDVINDTISCDSLILPLLSFGEFFTGTMGSGITLSPGSVITSDQTIYVYSSNTCGFDENNFFNHII
ncbi:MAG: hypothetical protein JNJ99_01965 [Crocinitomicaceae bacterium]|nr:hypothetical protein [Crocinitomicaceae bacterium]